MLNMIPDEAKEDSIAQIPYFDKVRNALRIVKDKKAIGPDRIPAEIYKFGGVLIQHQFHQLLIKIWINEVESTDLRDANTIIIINEKVIDLNVVITVGSSCWQLVKRFFIASCKINVAAAR